jgi:pimeloyl-ACP methyl ester carboxylesterase
MTYVLDPKTAPVTLQTLRWGRRDAPRVLLIHGVQSAAGTWWRIADGLARAGLHVTAPDLRGHGRSPSAGRYRLVDFVADLEGVGRDWELVVGHSLGGTLAAYALAHSPDFARRAVLLDPVFELPEDEFDDVVAGQLAELAAGEPAAIRLANPGWHPEDVRQKALAAAACSPHAAEAVLRDNRPWEYRALLADVTTPVTILGGDPRAGAMLDPALGEELAAANAGVDYRVLAGAGHSLHRDEPELVLQALLEAVDRAGVR